MTSHYDQNYDLLFADIHQNKKIYIGSKPVVTCRFCGLGKPDTSFRKTAHAIPEFLGNKCVIVNDECDICNERFSRQLEDHLAKFTKPLRTFAQIKGKEGVPSYKSTDKKSRIDFVPGRGLKICDRIDSTIVSFNEQENAVTVNVHLEPYIPAAVYKCLVKIALSVIDRGELPAFEDTIRWITESDHSKQMLKSLHLVRTFIPGSRPNPTVALFVLRRKRTVKNVPYCVSVLAFGNSIYQIRVEICDYR